MTIGIVHENHAPKAIIFREDGKLLMQQRDFTKGLPFPGRWTFFGGSAEKNENIKNALKRELIEELEFIPEKINKQLFKWTWKSDWTIGHNYFFPIFLKKRKKLSLKEGASMKWFALKDFIKYQTTPDVYENFSKIYNFLLSKKLIHSNSIKKFENYLLKRTNLTKKNNRVFYNIKKTSTITRQEIFLLKNLASIKKEKIFRICLHNSDNSKIHEMIIMHIMPIKVGPLKQNKDSLSYHLIEGDISIKTYENKRKKVTEHKLSTHNGSRSIRLEANKYREIITRSPFAIFLEVCIGPFKDSDTIWQNLNSKIVKQNIHKYT